MATIAVNTPDSLQFVNVSMDSKKDAPTLVIQAGEWQIGDHDELGIVFDVSGNEAPILTANDARKLSKWLLRAADNLEGVKNSDKKRKSRSNYDYEDDDEFDKY